MLKEPQTLVTLKPLWALDVGFKDPRPPRHLKPKAHLGNLGFRTEGSGI